MRILTGSINVHDSSAREEDDSDSGKYSVVDNRPCKHCQKNHEYASIMCGVIMYANAGNDLDDFVSRYPGSNKGEIVETPEDGFTIHWLEGARITNGGDVET
jgi:hypothetical protein